MLEHLSRHPIEQPGWGGPQLHPESTEPACSSRKNLAPHGAEGGLQLRGGLLGQPLGSEQRPQRLGETGPGPGQPGGPGNRSGRPVRTGLGVGHDLTRSFDGSKGARAPTVAAWSRPPTLIS